VADDQVERVLVVAAHPDDVDFGAAGTVAWWTSAGIDVSYCIVTDGDAGGFDVAVPRSEIPRIRRAEQTASAAAIGVTDVAFLGYPDGRLVSTIELRRDIARAIRQIPPQRLVCHVRREDGRPALPRQPDHRRGGRGAEGAGVDGRSGGPGRPTRRSSG